MVGFIPEPTIEEEQQHLNQASKVKSFNDPLDPFHPKVNDLALVDSFPSFDSIQHWFDDNLNFDSVRLNNCEFGAIERVMEVVQEESTEKTSVKNQFPLVSEPTSNMAELVGCSSNSTGCVSTCLLKVNSEEEAHKQEGDFSCCIEEKMEKVKAVEEASGEETLIRDQLLLVAEPVDRPELVVGSSKQNEHLSSCLKIEDQECHQPEGTIVEEMGKVSLVGGSQNFPADGNCVPKIEPQNEADSESSSESESESSSSGSDSTDNSSDDEEEEEDAKKQQVEGKMYLEREGNVAGEIEEGEIRNVDGEAGNGTNDDSADDESEEDEIDDDDDDDDDNGDQMISASDIEFGDIGDDDVNEQITGPIKSKNELQVD